MSAQTGVQNTGKEAGRLLNECTIACSKYWEGGWAVVGWVHHRVFKILGRRVGVVGWVHHRVFKIMGRRLGGCWLSETSGVENTG